MRPYLFTIIINNKKYLQSILLAAIKLNYQNTVYNAASIPQIINEPMIKAGETLNMFLSISMIWVSLLLFGFTRLITTIKITAEAPTAEELTPAPEEAGTDGTVVATSDTAVVVTTVATDSDDDSNTTMIVVVAAIVVVILVGGGIALSRRNSTTPKTPTPPAPTV